MGSDSHLELDAGLSSKQIIERDSLSPVAAMERWQLGYGEVSILYRETEALRSMIETFYLSDQSFRQDVSVEELFRHGYFDPIESSCEALLQTGCSVRSLLELGVSVRVVRSHMDIMTFYNVLKEIYESSSIAQRMVELYREQLRDRAVFWAAYKNHQILRETSLTELVLMGFFQYGHPVENADDYYNHHYNFLFSIPGSKFDKKSSLVLAAVDTVRFLLEEGVPIKVLVHAGVSARLLIVAYKIPVFSCIDYVGIEAPNAAGVTLSDVSSYYSQDEMYGVSISKKPGNLTYSESKDLTYLLQIFDAFQLLRLGYTLGDLKSVGFRGFSDDQLAVLLKDAIVDVRSLLDFGYDAKGLLEFIERCSWGFLSRSNICRIVQSIAHAVNTTPVELFSDSNFDMNRVIDLLYGYRYTVLYRCWGNYALRELIVLGFSLIALLGGERFSGKPDVIVRAWLEYYSECRDRAILDLVEAYSLRPDKFTLKVLLSNHCVTPKELLEHGVNLRLIITAALSLSYDATWLLEDGGLTVRDFKAAGFSAKELYYSVKIQQLDLLRSCYTDEELYPISHSISLRQLRAAGGFPSRTKTGKCKKLVHHAKLFCGFGWKD